MIFVDTNYFLRFLLKDIKSQHVKAEKLFEEAALGKEKLFSSVIVFFEIYWVMKSVYEKDKKEVVEILENVLKMDFVSWENDKLLHKVVEVYKNKNVEIEDAYNVVLIKNKRIKKIKTFDLKLKKLV